MTRQYWSCFSAGTLEESTALYGDVLGVQYEYDSNVVNHKGIKAGDVLLIRDAQLVHGYGVVEDVTSRDGSKMMRRCPVCRFASVAPRVRVSPAYRCRRCRSTFDVPLDEPMDVVVYTASYRSGWYQFETPARLRDLDTVYAGKDQQNAIRRLDPARAEALLLEVSGVVGMLGLHLVTAAGAIPEGHVEAIVRVRRGQQRFRESLLGRYGSTCAVTGAQPEDVLDAAHLYSYADRAVHDPGGGLLLRSDIHRMFDRLLLTFDPTTWTSRVAPALLDEYPALRALDAQPMAITEVVRPDPTLLEDHFGAATNRWKARWQRRDARRPA